jgi:O-antigen/teichoic acid export membrane protein
VVTTEQRPRASARALLRGGAGIAVAMMVTNVATYGYTVLAAHLIGKESLGAFTALMAVLLVVGVLSLGIQATGARRISADPDSVVAIESVVLGVGLRSAVALGLLCLALAPVFNAVLHLHSLAAAAMVALAAAPLTYMGAQAGVLQGERRWHPLALLYLGQGLGRVVCGAGLIILWPGELSAMVGVAIGAWVPVVIGYLALRRPRTVSRPDQGHPGLELLREVGLSSQALLAFFALSNADILLARASLSHAQAGLYAAGLILAKAVLFLPQFVVVIAFPSMSTKGASHRTLVLAVGLTLALGACVVAGVSVLRTLALTFVGGGGYGQISDDLWKFAVIGTLLAVNQLLVYSALARQQRRAIMMIWTTLAVLLVVGITRIGSVFSLVNLVITLDGLLFVALFATAVTTSVGNRGEPRDPVDEALLQHEG